MILLQFGESVPQSHEEDGYVLEESGSHSGKGHYMDKAQQEHSCVGVRRIMVDETSARKGLRYVSNLLDADPRELLLMVEGRESKALSALLKSWRALRFEKAILDVPCRSWHLSRMEIGAF